MEIELAVSFFLLVALTFLATVDMAFGQLSDVGLRRLLPLLRPFYRVLAYAAEPWHRSFDRLRRQEQIKEALTDDPEEDTGDDIEALIDVGEAEGIIEEEERELIQSAIEFGDTRVDAVMTPRTEIAALPQTSTIRDARNLIIESRHSRLPVYRDQI